MWLHENKTIKNSVKNCFPYRGRVGKQTLSRYPSLPITFVTLLLPSETKQKKAKEKFFGIVYAKQTQKYENYNVISNVSTP